MQKRHGDCCDFRGMRFFGYSAEVFERSFLFCVSLWFSVERTGIDWI